MNWYEIKDKAEISEIWLYGEIGGGGIGAKEFIGELNAIKSKKIAMHINSPGGGVFEGYAIYNAIKRHPATITSFIDGVAASIASIIAIAAEKVVIAKNGMFMIHDPHGLVVGTAKNMRQTADTLDKIRSTMVEAYVEKSGKPADEIETLMNQERLYKAQEAIDAGFADAMGVEMDLAACATFAPIMEKLGFKNIPNFNAKKELPSEREIERVLREHAGCSQKQAKAILAEGYKADYRDDNPAITASEPEPVQRDVEPVAQRDAVQPENVDVPAKGKRIADRHLYLTH